MERRIEHTRARALTRATTTLILSGALLVGCRNAPFYRMTSRASQSLPLSREGVIAFERGDLNLAEERFEEALKLNDADVETNRYYGETLWRQGKRRKAMEALVAAADKNGAVDSETSLCRSLAEKSLELDDDEGALRWSNKMIDLSPKNADGWRLRGKAHKELAQYSDALLDFQRAAHFAPDDREILREIALLQNALGDYDAALATWQCLERLYPTRREPAEVFAGKADAYAGLGLMLEAEEACAVAVRYEPDSTPYRAKLAQIIIARGDAERALLALEEASKRAPEDLAFQEYCRKVRARVEANAQEIARHPEADAARR